MDSLAEHLELQDIRKAILASDDAKYLRGIGQLLHRATQVHPDPEVFRDLRAELLTILRESYPETFEDFELLADTDRRNMLAVLRRSPGKEFLELFCELERVERESVEPDPRHELFGVADITSTLRAFHSVVRVRISELEALGLDHSASGAGEQPKRGEHDDPAPEHHDTTPVEVKHVSISDLSKLQRDLSRSMTATRRNIGDKPQEALVEIREVLQGVERSPHLILLAQALHLCGRYALKHGKEKLFNPLYGITPRVLSGLLEEAMKHLTISYNLTAISNLVFALGALNIEREAAFELSKRYLEHAPKIASALELSTIMNFLAVLSAPREYIAPYLRAISTAATSKPQLIKRDILENALHVAALYDKPSIDYWNRLITTRERYEPIIQRSTPSRLEREFLRVFRAYLQLHYPEYEFSFAKNVMKHGYELDIVVFVHHRGDALFSFGIEVDGPSHKGRELMDDMKDSVCAALGTPIIRIRHMEWRSIKADFEKPDKSDFEKEMHTHFRYFLHAHLKANIIGALDPAEPLPKGDAADQETSSQP